MKKILKFVITALVLVSVLECNPHQTNIGIEVPTSIIYNGSEEFYYRALWEKYKVYYTENLSCEKRLGNRLDTGLTIFDVVPIIGLKFDSSFHYRGFYCIPIMFTIDEYYGYCSSEKLKSEEDHNKNLFFFHEDLSYVIYASQDSYDPRQTVDLILKDYQTGDISHMTYLIREIKYRNQREAGFRQYLIENKKKVEQNKYLSFLVKKFSVW